MSVKGVTLFLGIVLLAGTFALVRFVFNSSSANPGTSKNGVQNTSGIPDKVFCWGYFEAEQGVAHQYPGQFGVVDDYKPENSVVKKGDVLLQVHDTMAALKVKLAESAVKVSEQQLLEARRLPQYYALQVEQQKSAIKAVELEYQELEKTRDTKISADLSPALRKTIEAMYGFGLSKLEEKKKVEEARLKQIELQDAQIKILQAEADLAAKETQFKEAQEFVRLFQIRAPENGKVLRVYVKRGETLGPNPRVQALDFLPDGPIIVRAEILQEWGRFVKEKQPVEIEDDIYQGQKWEGTIKSILAYYAQTRSPVIEPFRYNDVRTLECVIELKNADGARIGQRVRAKIKI